MHPNSNHFFEHSRFATQADLLLKGILFSLNFLPWEFLLMKKLEIKKTETTELITFKTDIIKVGLVFSISNFFTNKNAPKKKSIYRKRPTWLCSTYNNKLAAP